MKRISFMFLFVIFCFTQFAYSEEKIVTDTRTGDSELDRSLKELNDGVQSNLRDFAKNLSRYYNVPEETVDWLLDSVGMTPADAYMATKVSKIANQPVEDVVNEYKANKGKGWGVIAKNLGIKPGSNEFQELKKDDSGLLGATKGKKKKEKKGKGKKGKNK